MPKTDQQLLLELYEANQKLAATELAAEKAEQERRIAHVEFWVLYNLIYPKSTVPLNQYRTAREEFKQLARGHNESKEPPST